MKKKKLLGIFTGIFAVGALCLIPTLVTEAANKHPFTDIKSNSTVDSKGLDYVENGDNLTNVLKLYYKENDTRKDTELNKAVQYLYEKGILYCTTDKYGENKYGKSKTFMRYDWMTCLWSMAGNKYEGTNYFFEIYPDVEYDLQYDENGNFSGHKNYYTIATVWGCKNRVMTGYPTSGEFGVKDGIKRKDAITAISNYYMAMGGQIFEEDSKYEKEIIDKVESYKNNFLNNSYLKYRFAWAIQKGILVGEGGTMNLDEVIKRDEGAIILYRFLNATNADKWSTDAQK